MDFASGGDLELPVPCSVQGNAQLLPWQLLWGFRNLQPWQGFVQAAGREAGLFLQG